VATRVRINGSALARVAEVGLDEVINEAMEAGVEMAQHLVPVDTGELHDGIEIIEFASGGRGSYGVTDVEHAEHVEFGTEKMAAQPYLRPSIDALKSHLR
jgi:HK97 gp10 family phage protein